MVSPQQTTLDNSRFGPKRGFHPWAWIKRNKWVLLAALIALLILVWIIRPKTDATPPGGRGAGMPMAVNTAKVEKGDVQVILNALGTVTPLQSVTVRTQINGQLQQVAFIEGQMVKKGDFLAEVDPRPYQAALEQAQGTLAKDQALLKNALLDVDRYRKLVAEDSIAHQQLDTQEALVRQYQGTVITDQAAVDNAKLNLDYCHIVSPVTGRVGLRQVDQGNYVTPGDANGLVVVTQLQPISVLFTLPEDNVLKVSKPLHAGEALAVVAMDRANTTKLATGALTNIDNQIDTTTGTFKMRAQFANTDESLFPNQFVNVQLQVETLHDQIVVPTAAIQRGAPGTFVYAVNPDSTVSVKPVKLGVAQGERQAILSGIDVGDTIVTDGVDRLRDGAKVILPGAQPPAPGAGGAAGNRRHRHNNGEAGGANSGGANAGGANAGAATGAGANEGGANGVGTSGAGGGEGGANGGTAPGAPGSALGGSGGANGGSAGGRPSAQ
jgi:multidrug efflux system membrane fusion protein